MRVCPNEEEFERASVTAEGEEVPDLFAIHSNTFFRDASLSLVPLISIFRRYFFKGNPKDFHQPEIHLVLQVDLRLPYNLTALPSSSPRCGVTPITGVALLAAWDIRGRAFVRFLR
jgi:hypothetical protein